MSEKNNMQQSNHNSFCDAPIIDVFYCNGKPINFRCRGDIKEIILRMKLLTRRVSPSLPAQPTAENTQEEPPPADGQGEA